MAEHIPTIDHIVLLADLDNTLFNWIDYFAPCFRAMVQVLADITEVPEDEICLQFKQVYSNRGISECSGTIQELELYKQQPAHTREQLQRAAWIAFSRARKRCLHPYPHVRSTMHWLKRQDAMIIGVTNSCAVDAVNRIHLLKLASFFDALVAWDGTQTDATRLPELSHRCFPNRQIICIPSFSRKPSAEAYRAALMHPGARSKPSIWVIGDSMSNDLLPAKEVGARTVWARYGRRCDQQNLDTVTSVTHWGAEQIQRAYDTTLLVPDFVIDDFADLRKIVVACDRTV